MDLFRTVSPVRLPSLRMLGLLVLFVGLASHVQESEGRSVALPAPQCHPAVVQTMKPRIRQICKALEAIWEFSDAMENYLDEKESEDYLNSQNFQMSGDQRPISNSGVKRKGEDIDHVFLRFGKRGGVF